MISKTNDQILIEVIIFFVQIKIEQKEPMLIIGIADGIRKNYGCTSDYEQIANRSWDNFTSFRVIKKTM
jgi:hypothetical protein